MSFRSPRAGALSRSSRREKMTGGGAPRPSQRKQWKQRKRRQRSRHGSGNLRIKQQRLPDPVQQNEADPASRGTSINGETQHGTDNASKHGSLVHSGADQPDVPDHLS